MQRMVLTAVLLFGLLGWGVGRDISLPEGAYGLGLSWAPDGRGIAVVYRIPEGTFAGWLDLPDGSLRWRLGDLGIYSWVNPVVVSPSGEKLAVGGRSQILLISASHGSGLSRLELGDRYQSLAISFLPEGKVAALVAETSGVVGGLSLAIWDPVGGVERRPLGLRFTPASRPMAAFSADGRYLAFAAGTEEEPGGEAWLVHLLDLRSETLRSWDLRELVAPELREGMEALNYQIASVALHPAGTEIAVGLFSTPPGRPLLLRLDVETGELIHQLFPGQWQSYMVAELVYSPDGEFLAFSGSSPMYPIFFRTLGLVNLAQHDPTITLLCQTDPDRERLDECPHLGPRFSPDGSRLASLWQGTVRLWELCPEVELPAAGWTFYYASGGAYIPTGPEEWQVQLEASGELLIARQVMDEVEEFGPFQLSPDESARLWALIQDANLSSKASSTRLGIPDEARSTFRLVGPTCVHEVSLWEGDVREDPALAALLLELASLIRRYTGEDVNL